MSSNELVTCDLLELSQLSSLCSLDLSANRIDSLLALPFLPGLRSLSVAFNSLSSLAGVDNNGLILSSDKTDKTESFGGFVSCHPLPRPEMPIPAILAIILSFRPAIVPVARVCLHLSLD